MWHCAVSVCSTSAAPGYGSARCSCPPFDPTWTCMDVAQVLRVFNAGGVAGLGRQRLALHRRRLRLRSGPVPGTAGASRARLSAHRHRRGRPSPGPPPPGSPTPRRMRDCSRLAGVSCRRNDRASPPDRQPSTPPHRPLVRHRRPARQHRHQPADDQRRPRQNGNRPPIRHRGHRRPRPGPSLSRGASASAVAASTEVDAAAGGQPHRGVLHADHEVKPVRAWTEAMHLVVGELGLPLHLGHGRLLAGRLA